MEEITVKRGMYKHRENPEEQVWVLATMVSKKSGKPFVAFTEVMKDSLDAGEGVLCLTEEEFTKNYTK